MYARLRRSVGGAADCLGARRGVPGRADALAGRLASRTWDALGLALDDLELGAVALAPGVASDVVLALREAVDCLLCEESDALALVCALVTTSTGIREAGESDVLESLVGDCEELSAGAREGVLGDVGGARSEYS